MAFLGGKNAEVDALNRESRLKIAYQRHKFQKRIMPDEQVSP